ncbi:MAG: methyltransferase domain-containing protein [Chloroflexota bacterium]|nr:methyltransferase domain-containing protein [Chloroflexota bacterium]
MTLLEAGCGHGRDMAWLEAAGAAVVGIDLSAGMLAQARARASGSLIQADLRCLPLASGHFHGAWCSASLLHLPKVDAPSALAELRRSLVLGGALLLSLQEGTVEIWERGAYGDPDAERFFARYGPDEVEALLARAGFVVHERTSEAAGPRRWLRLLATGGDGSAESAKA